MKYLLIIMLVWILMLMPLSAQRSFRVMSYNVENFFDTNDNPHKNDDEFLPDGNHYWTFGRYYHKLQQIAKVISAAGEWKTPAIIGLCEIENDSILYDLTHRTPLRTQEYQYVITDLSDSRGINVGLLYQREQFRYLGHQSISIRFSKQKHKSTRQILHVSGEVISRDTLDIFICHFPSRYGGEKESEHDRWDASTTLRSVCDSITYIRQKPKILIMGDFNDTPTDKSITQILGASILKKGSINYGPLNNILPISDQKGVKGTHKFQGEWSQLDHIIVNSGLLEKNSQIQIQRESVHIFAPSFLVTKDKTWRGIRPLRTYHGYKYERGFSDHLPIFADFYLHLSTKH